MSYRKTGIAIGLLFVVATFAFMAGHGAVLGVLGGGVGGPAAGAAAADALTTGTLLLFVDALAVAAIGFLFFPVLKRYGEAFALGYVGLRVGEYAAVLLLMAAAMMPALPSVASTSAQWAEAGGGVDASTLEHLLPVAAALYRAAMTLVFLCVAASGIVLSWVLVRGRLVPRAIGGLGLIGYAAMLLGTGLDLFGVLDLQQGAATLLLAGPVGLFENLALPLWLFFRGFDTGFVDGGRAAAGGVR